MTGTAGPNFLKIVRAARVKKSFGPKRFHLKNICGPKDTVLSIHPFYSIYWHIASAGPTSPVDPCLGAGPQFFLDPQITAGPPFTVDAQIAAGPLFLLDSHIAVGPLFCLDPRIAWSTISSGIPHSCGCTIFSGPSNCSGSSLPVHCCRSTIFLYPHIAGGPLFFWTHTLLEAHYFFLDLQSAYCCGSKILLLVCNSFWTKHTSGSTKFSRSKPPFCRFIIFYGLHHITVVTAFSLRISAA